MTASETLQRQQAHDLLERIPADQIRTAVGMLQFMLLDPVSRAMAIAPLDDEPESQAERLAVAEADKWLAGNKPIPFDELLSEFGLTQDSLRDGVESR